MQDITCILRETLALSSGVGPGELSVPLGVGPFVDREVFIGFLSETHVDQGPVWRRGPRESGSYLSVGNCVPWQGPV